MKKKHIYILPWAFLTVAIIPFIYVVIAYMSAYSILSGNLSYDPASSTKIYDINGDLISELFDENRTIVKSDVMPVAVKRAFIAAEDRNFYFHSGIDITGILRAAIINLVSGGFRQGGSTITQQLVKRMYTGGEKTLFRKITEIFLAREFEKRFTKDSILDMYLNQIYFGHGVYGVSSGARFFLGKELADLTPVEAALLAAIPAAPERYSPLKKPHAAFERHKRILRSMIEAGWLSEDDAGTRFDDFWSRYLDRIRTKYQTLSMRSKGFDRAPYFTEYIRRILVDRYGEELVYRGGIHVYTTLDLRQQNAAVDALKKGIEEQKGPAVSHNMPQLDSLYRHMELDTLNGSRKSRREIETRIRFLSEFRNNSLSEVLLASIAFCGAGVGPTLDDYDEICEETRLGARVEGALVALDPATGAITAMVGGSGFNAANQLNRAVQSTRQPGSAFKAFVYGAGIESKKITPATSFYDVPVVFKGTEKVWKPSNYEDNYRGRVLVRDALAASLNIISVLVVDETEPKHVAEFASRLTGIPLKRFAVDPSISLGTSEASPIEMARGFAAYANGGLSVEPFAVMRITDRRDAPIYERKPDKERGRRVVSEQTAFIMTSMLRSVVDEGTAAGGIRNSAGFRLPAAGKTGTTSGFRDAWFVGFTPDLVAAVWLGCDSQKFSLGNGQSASVAAAPVWGAFMRDVYLFRKPGRFRAQPEGVNKIDICASTGKLPAPGCQKRSEFFITGTEPTETCDRNHDAMTSIFDLVRDRKAGILEKEREKMDEDAARMRAEKERKGAPDAHH